MISLNGITVVVGKFPNNESFIDMELKDYGISEDSKHTTIYFKFEDDAEFIYLKFIKDFLDDHNIPASLILPYIPYSRMDRKEEKRLFTLKSVAKFINDLHFTSVLVYEPHSEVSVALFDRVKVLNMSKSLAKTVMYAIASGKPIEEFVKFNAHANFDMPEDLFLVFPDSGAAKRYSKQFNYPNVITCRKERDFNTGDIKSLKLEYIPGIKVKSAIIVDDLSSKGGTFLMTAKALKEELEVENIYLTVTHCENTIFSGHIFTSGLFKAVITTDSIIDTKPFNGDENLNWFICSPAGTDTKLLVRKI